MNKIIEYVINSPENTNPSVLKSLLDDPLSTADVIFWNTYDEDGNEEMHCSTSSLMELDSGEKALIYKRGNKTRVGLVFIETFTNKYIVYFDLGHYFEQDNIKCDLVKIEITSKGDSPENASFEISSFDYGDYTLVNSTPT